MREVNASYQILDSVNGDEILKRIEMAGRTCYKSEQKATVASSRKFVRKILQNGHESVIEHEKVSVKIVCDRGVSHEIVRHRLASYSQESTRYCNYSSDQFGHQISIIKPCFWKSKQSKQMLRIWKKSMIESENAYFQLIKLGATPQEARSVLPNSLKTEIVVTMNLREWRHFFKLRTSSEAHPQMREVVIPLLKEFKRKIPVIFDDIRPAN